MKKPVPDHFELEVRVTVVFDPKNVHEASSPAALLAGILNEHPEVESFSIFPSPLTRDHQVP